VVGSPWTVPKMDSTKTKSKCSKQTVLILILPLLQIPLADLLRTLQWRSSVVLLNAMCPLRQRTSS
jgi:hypothetical protein